MDTVYIIFSVLFGLAVGSFLNVCIYRIPKKEFFKSKRSFCPSCGKELKWYDMFPVFSWIFLRGKCRFCKAKISVRYPVVEALNAVLWVLSYLKFGLTPDMALFDILFSALIVMTFIDLDTKEIPNGIVLLIIALSVPMFFVSTRPDILWWHRLVGAVCVSVPLLIIAMVTGGIGGGDIKLFFALGLVLGYKLTLLGAGIAVITGGITGAILLAAKKAGRKTEMPLGPFIALGSVVVSLVGDNLLSLYMSMF